MSCFSKVLLHGGLTMPQVQGATIFESGLRDSGVQMTNKENSGREEALRSLMLTAADHTDPRYVYC